MVTRRGWGGDVVVIFVSGLGFLEVVIIALRIEIN